jgi:hypothetical protein
MKIFPAILAPLLLFVLALGACGCRQADVEPGPAAPAVVAGSVLNAYFPKDEGSADVVFVSENPGFSQAELRIGGEEVGTLSISDGRATPDLVSKFEGAVETIGGYPGLARGSRGTAILVGGRFQVQARATGDGFDATQRAEWLTRFDLAGLESLATR